jgi:hypothetical protein
MIAVAVGVAVTLAACGSSSGSRSSGTSGSTNHRTTLARGETAGIASQLTDVPGYRYVDPPASEVRQALRVLTASAQDAGVPGFFAAMSLHSVVAERRSRNTAATAAGTRETGFLQLVELSTTPPASIDQRELARIGSGSQRPVSSFAVHGTEVLVFRRADRPDSRWQYGWYRHGVKGAFDGATRAETERWVRAYLAEPEREPDENDALAAQLRPVPGFAYTNWWVPWMAEALRAVGSSPVSAHSVADRAGRIGTIVLVDGPLGADRLGAVIAAAVGSTATPRSGTISGMPVVTIDAPQGTIYAWTRNGITGSFTGDDPARSLAFITPYLAAVVASSPTPAG